MTSVLQGAGPTGQTRAVETRAVAVGWIFSSSSHRDKCSLRAFGHTQDQWRGAKARWVLGVDRCCLSHGLPRSGTHI